MAMLAENKRKNKWSNDPRNKAWSTDTNRFGYQMLERMGWKSGRGLGAKEDGQVSHVKVSKKNDNIGLGADKSTADNWLEHQFAFDNLLAELNQSTEGKGKGNVSVHRKKHKLEETAKESKKRVNYNRFIKCKDLSLYSDTDMACILGQRHSQTAPATPQHDQSEDSDSDRGSTASCPAATPTHDGIHTITSEHTVQEYFAKKMKELQAKRNEQNVGTSGECGLFVDQPNKSETCSSTRNSNGERRKKIKKKKMKTKECQEEVQDHKEMVPSDTRKGSKKMKSVHRKRGNEESAFIHCQESVEDREENVRETKRMKREGREKKDKKIRSKKKKKRKKKDGK